MHISCMAYGTISTKPAHSCVLCLMFLGDSFYLLKSVKESWNFMVYYLRVLCCEVKKLHLHIFILLNAKGNFVGQVQQ